MPANPIYTVFKNHECRLVHLSAKLKIPSRVFKKIKGCVEGKRKNLPFYFAAEYPGPGKERVGATVVLAREPSKETYRFHIDWFITSTPMPKDGLGDLRELFSCLAETFGERKIGVIVSFDYDPKKYSSRFLPIALQDTTVFDEIVEITGVKRNVKGELLYELDISTREQRLMHAVRISQAIKLSEALPAQLIENAGPISVLGLNSRGQNDNS